MPSMPATTPYTSDVPVLLTISMPPITLKPPQCNIALKNLNVSSLDKAAPVESTLL